MTAPQTPVLLGGSTDGSGDSDKVKAIRVDANGLLEIGASVSIDTTGLASSAKQDTGNTSLANIDTDLELVKQPTRMAAITKSDSTDVTATATKGLWVGGAGDVAVMGVGDSAAVTLSAVPAGTYIPGAYKRVMSTNTTATLIVSFYGP